MSSRKPDLSSAFCKNYATSTRFTICNVPNTCSQFDSVLIEHINALTYSGGLE